MTRYFVQLGLCTVFMAYAAGCGEGPCETSVGQGSDEADALEVQRNSIGMELVRIGAGAFTMGSPVGEAGRQPSEGPQREIRITRDFMMGRHEVTNAQFAKFVDETGYLTEAERDEEGGFGIDFESGRIVQARGITWREPGFPGFEPGPDHPVLLVSWHDAMAFCDWLSEREGRRYRLPTEAEWEYAARAGSTTPWSTGDDPRTLARMANIADESLQGVMGAAIAHEQWSDGFPFTAPVGSFAPNAFGLYDMHGNVWEWCADVWDDAYFLTAAHEDPLLPGASGFRAIRGGGWIDRAERARSAQRVWFDPAFRYCLLSGFRVVTGTVTGHGLVHPAAHLFCPHH